MTPIPDMTFTRRISDDLTIHWHTNNGATITTGDTTLHLTRTDALAASDALLGLPDHRNQR